LLAVMKMIEEAPAHADAAGSPSERRSQAPPDSGSRNTRPEAAGS
jgi:hypothetical protein